MRKVVSYNKRHLAQGTSFLVAQCPVVADTPAYFNTTPFSSCAHRVQDEGNQEQGGTRADQVDKVAEELGS